MKTFSFNITIPQKVTITMVMAILLCIVNPIFSIPVDSLRALSFAQKFFSQNMSTKSGRLMVPNFKLVQKEPYLTNNVKNGRVEVSNEGDFLYYIFNLENNNGFIIVAGDDASLPVLAYSNEGNFDLNTDNPGIKIFLENYKSQISSIKLNKSLPTNEIVAAWELKSNSKNARTALNPNFPLIKTKWGQGGKERNSADKLYNRLCPSSNSQKTLAGCVAIAIAQVMKFHNFPNVAKGTGKYKVKNGTTKTFTEVSLDDEKYDWNQMPDLLNEGSPISQKNEISKLIYHCGVSVNTSYGINESTAYLYSIPSAFRSRFGYSNDIKWIGQNDNSWDNSKINLFKTELSNNRPIILRGGYVDDDGNEGGGHCFILDGYDDNGLFSINWGWYGETGYYALNDLNPTKKGDAAGKGTYNINQQAIINIIPENGISSNCAQYYPSAKANISNNSLWYKRYAEYATENGLVESNNGVFLPNKIIKVKDAARTIFLAANSLSLNGYDSFNIISCDVNNPNLAFLEYFKLRGIVSQLDLSNSESPITLGLLCKMINSVILGSNFPMSIRNSNYTKSKIKDDAFEKNAIFSVMNIRGVIKNEIGKNSIEFILAGFKNKPLSGVEEVKNSVLCKLVSNAIEAYKSNKLNISPDSPLTDSDEFYGSENPDDYTVIGDKYEFENTPFGTEIPQSYDPPITIKSGESKTFTFPDPTIGGLPVHLYWTIDGGTLTPNTGTFQSVIFKAPVVTKTKVLQLYSYAATSGGYVMESYREVTVTPNNSQAITITNNGSLDYGNVTYQSNTSKSTVLSLTSGSSFSGNARIVGTNASNFIMNTLNVTLNGTSTQTLNISFSASSPGTKIATLEIYNSNGVVLTVPITGNVQANDACLSASISSVDIQTGNTNTPADYFFTLTNQSTVNSITVNNVQFTGSDAQYFSYDAQLFKVPQTINRSISTGFAVKVLNTQNQSRTYNATLQLTTNNSLCPTLTIPVSSQYLQSNLSFISPEDGYVYIMDPSSDGLELKWQGQIPGSDPLNIAVDIEYAVNKGAWNLIPNTISCQVIHNNNNPFNIKNIRYQDLSTLNLIGKEVQFRIRPCNLSNPWQYSGNIKFVAPNSKPIEITSPNGNEVFTAGEIKKITWNDYVGFNSVDLFYSTNYGSSYILIASGVSAKNGFYDWTVPNGINSDNCIVKVVAQNIFDASDSSFFIQTPPPSPFVISSVNTNPEGCLTNPQGTITINLQNLAISGEATFYKNDGTLVGSYGITGNVNTMFATYSNLVSGNYKVIIRDFNNKRQVVEAFVPLRGNYAAALYAKDDVCSGGKGQIQVNLTNNFPSPGSYTFFKNDVQIYSGFSPTLDNISSGTYKVNIVGTDGCLTQETTSITSSPGTYFPITPTVTNTSCSGSTGAILLNAGTTQTPTYLWSNGATTQNLTALAAGQYSVYIRDASGCVQTQKYEVFEEGGLVETTINYAPRGAYNNFKVNQGKLYFNNYRATNDPAHSLGIIDLNNNSFGSLQIPSLYNSGINFMRQPKTLDVTDTDIYTVVDDGNSSISETHFIRINKSNNQILNRKSISGQSYYAKIQFINGKLYALRIDKSMDIIDFTNNTAINFIFPDNLYNFVYNVTNNKLYLVGDSHQLFEYDLTSNTITRTGAISINRNYQINLIGSSLFITGFNNTNQDGINVESFELGTFVSTGKTKIRNLSNGTWGRSFTKNNRYLYLPSTLNYIDIFDTQTKSVVTIPVSTSVNDIDYEPNIDKILIKDGGSKIIRLDNNKFDFTTSKNDATCGLSNGNITLTIPNDGKTYTYLWSNGVTTKDASNLSAGDYTVTVTQTGGCSVRKTITITQTSAAFTASVSPNNGNLCPNTTLSLVSSLGQSYIWYKDNVVITGATSQTYNATLAGNYKVVITNSNNCTATSNIVPITVISNPVANFTSTISGNKTTFTNTSTNGNQYLWTFGDGTTDTQFSPIKTYSSNNTYTVRLRTTNSCGQYNEISKSIIISCLPSATLSGTRTITAGQSATLSVALTGTSPWSVVVNGVTYSGIIVSPYTFSITPSVTTTYTISSVSNSCGAGTVSGSAVVTVNPACTIPAAPTTVSDSRCGVGVVTLFSGSACSGTKNWYSSPTGGNSIGTGNYSFNTPIISVTTNYYVSCTIGTCESPRTIVTATIKPIPNPPTITANPSTIIAGQSSTLTATGCSSGDIMWTNNGLGIGFIQTVSPAINTRYSAYCRINSCLSASVGSTTITVNPCTNMYTLKTGNWNDITVWSCGRTPTISDDVTISAGHTVTIPAGQTGFVNKLTQNGNLSISSLGALKIKTQ